MADAIEDGALVTRAEEALLALRSGGIVAGVAATVDDQRWHADARVPRKLRLRGGVRGVGRRQPPPDPVGVQHDLRPVGVVERRGRRRELLVGHAPAWVPDGPDVAGELAALFADQGG